MSEAGPPTVVGLRPLVLINSLWQGGAEQSTADALLRLAAAGARPEVLCLREGHMPLADELREAGLPVTHLAHGNHLATVRDLRHRLRTGRPDLLHVILFESTLLGTLAAQGTGIPVVASVVSTPLAPVLDGPDAAGLKRRIVQTAERTALRRARTVHAVTAGVATSVAEVHGIRPARITVVERGRSPERFAPVTAERRAATRAALGIEERDELVLAVGRHERDKGFERLVAAFDPLDRPRLRVLVAGRDGVASTALRDAIAAARHPERFRLLGERHDVPDLLGAADLFALTSRREGAAGAALEAMGVGTPVVAMAVDGLRDVLHDGIDARVVPAGDTGAFGQAAAELLDDRPSAARLAAAASELFRSRFTLERAAEGMGRLYAEVAAAAPARARG